MSECWLKPNRRPTIATLGLSIIFGGLGAIGLSIALSTGNMGLAIALAAVALVAAAVGVYCGRQLTYSRVAYREGDLLIHDGTRDMAIPVDVVEVFFLGSGPIAQDAGGDGPRAANVVIRIAESASQWHNGQMLPAVGQWSDGYIILRGAWCEPIGHERLNQINHRLAEVRRQRREGCEEASQVGA